MLKRTVSLMLVLAICFLASCDIIGGKDAGEIIDAAEIALKSKEYTVNTTVMFTSNDEDMKKAVSDFSDVTLTFSTEGYSSKSTLNMNVDGVAVMKEYLITSSVLYYTYTESKGDDTYGLKKKVNLYSDERADMLEKIGMSAPLSYADFEDVKIESSKNVDLITCSKIKIEPSLVIADLVKSSLGADDAEVMVTDAEFVIRFVDGEYNGEYLFVAYSVILNNVTYDLEMQLSREYDLTTPVEISAPANAEEYIETTYAELNK